MKTFSLLSLVLWSGLSLLGAETVTVDRSHKGAATTVTDTNRGNNQLLYFTSPA